MSGASSPSPWPVFVFPNSDDTHDTCESDGRLPHRCDSPGGLIGVRRHSRMSKKIMERRTDCFHAFIIKHLGRSLTLIMFSSLLFECMNVSASSPHEGGVSRITRVVSYGSQRLLILMVFQSSPLHQMKQKGHYGGSSPTQGPR